MEARDADAESLAEITKNESLLCQTLCRKASNKTGDRVKSFLACISAATGMEWREVLHPNLASICEPFLIK